MSSFKRSQRKYVKKAYDHVARIGVLFVRL